VRDYINELKGNSPIKPQPYFSRLIDGEMSFEQFKVTQLNIFPAVSYFSLPMFYLCTRLESYEKRINILENINDEHGNGNLSESHGVTYKSYLISLGIKKDTIEQSPVQPSVEYFNNILMETVKNKNVLLAIACLGMIEERYAEISKLLVENLINKKWIKAEELTHYSMHQEVDKHHSDLFFRLVESEWKEYLSSRQEIVSGIDLGNDLVLNLYNDLLK